jgi:hypothetical protein
MPSLTSKLPQSLQKGLAAAFVIEIITDTFSWVFKEALSHLSRELCVMRPAVMTATTHPATSINDKDEENSEVQRFLDGQRKISWTSGSES